MDGDDQPDVHFAVAQGTLQWQPVFGWMDKNWHSSPSFTAMTFHNGLHKILETLKCLNQQFGAASTKLFVYKPLSLTVIRFVVAMSFLCFAVTEACFLQLTVVILLHRIGSRWPIMRCMKILVKTTPTRQLPWNHILTCQVAQWHQFIHAGTYLTQLISFILLHFC